MCLPDGQEASTLSFCVPNGAVVKVNLPSSGDFYVVTKQAPDVKFISELLCIVSDRNPDVGDQYPDPPTGPVNDNANLGQCPAAASVPARTAPYQFRSYVYVQQGTTSATPFPLTVPFPAFSNECNDQLVVGYLQPIPTGNMDFYSACQRDLTALTPASVCTGSGLLTPGYYTTLRFLTGQGSSVAALAMTATYQYLNATTGALTPIASPISAYNATSGRCTNVVRYMNMTAYYTLIDETDPLAQGYIDAIEVAFVLTDVLVNSATPLQQGIRVSWLQTAIPQPLEVVTSGNPGYITGFPVLAGTLATKVDVGGDKQAINRLVGGMPVAAPGVGGACDPTSLSFIGYGANTTSTCSISLTLTQLRDFCVNEASNPGKYVAQVLSSLYPAILNNTLYFGEWGNSNFTNMNEWIQVTVSGYPFRPMDFPTSELACSGVIVGFDLQIVTGVAFSSSNLQQKVLYANLCFKTGVWDYVEQLPTGSSQRFFLNFNVTFIRIPQQAVTVKQPAPPLVVPLPPDLFYPFVATTSGAVRGGGALSVWLLAALVALALATVQQLQQLLHVP